MGKEYNKYEKKHVYLEWVSLFSLWLLFLVGILCIVLFSNSEVMYTILLCIGAFILLFALIPFIADHKFYMVIWRGMKNGKEIVFKAQTSGSIFSSSILGAKEVWIEK